MQKNNIKTQIEKIKLNNNKSAIKNYNLVIKDSKIKENKKKDKKDIFIK